MSLHDIDKSQNNRNQPVPNANDQREQYMAQGTTQAQNHGATDVADGLKIKERQIIARQNGYNKAAFGFYGTANKFGLKVAKEGYDVLTATDDQLVFNSEQNTFKISKTGTATLVGSTNISNGTTQTVTVPHGLSTTPAMVVYANAPNGSISGFQGGNGIMNLPIMYALPAAGGGLPWFWIQARVDATNIYFDLVCVGGTANNLATFTWTFTYYLLQETAN